jgi:phage tail-like protein
MPQTGQDLTPLSSTSFIISIAGVQIALFQELSGINSEVEHVEYISSDPQGNIVHQRLYGKTSPPTVTLKRGMDQNLYMWGWHLRVRNGDPGAPTDCDLSICGPDRKPKVQFRLVHAWPRKVQMGTASAGKDMLTEEVTLVCDEIETVQM